MATRGYYGVHAWKSWPMRRDAAHTRRPKITPRTSWALKTIRCSNRLENNRQRHQQHGAEKLREALMRDRFALSMLTVAVAAASVGAVISATITKTSGQAPIT